MVWNDTPNKEITKLKGVKHMKLTELQDILGKEITKLTNKEDLTTFDLDKANAISKMACQMISNASVILRANKRNDKNDLI